MKLLPALAFVSLNHKKLCFYSVSEFINEDTTAVVNYIEKTWIGLVWRSRKRAPVFPIEMWNSFNEEIPKTNNHLGGWHMTSESQLTASHPLIWKFIEAIQREQSLTVFDLAVNFTL